jgi:acetyl-CoA synthetase
MIYLPMIPEAVIAMLACARIGAPAQRGLQRLQRRGAQGTHQRLRREGDHHRRRRFRRGTIARHQAQRRRGAARRAKVESVSSSSARKQEVTHDPGPRLLAGTRKSAAGQRRLQGRAARQRASALHPLHQRQHGQTEGHPPHHGGLPARLPPDHEVCLRPAPEDVYFCTADVGWITGHSYVAYGRSPTAARASSTKGAPNHPEPDRFWRIIDRHKVNIFYTAPTAIRSFIKWGDDWLAPHDLSSLRLLGSVGEPINPEAWMWYHDKVGGKRCPIVDTWWQTETGCHMIAPMPGATPLKPGSATLPFFGVDAAVVDDNGKEVRAERRRQAGHPPPVALDAPHHLRRRRALPQNLLERIKGCYFAGDGARRDKDGYFWIVGRIDDVLNVAGHRLGTSEVESALVSHPDVAEAAVVGRPDELKGQASWSLRHAQERRGARAGAEGSPARPCRQGNRPHRQARRHPLRRGRCPRRAAEKSCAACSNF